MHMPFLYCSMLTCRSWPLRLQRMIAIRSYGLPWESRKLTSPTDIQVYAMFHDQSTTNDVT